MTTNPEQSVLDEIDALVDEQMAGGEYAAEYRTSTVVADVDRCALCKGAWHGDPWTGVDHQHLGEYDRHSHGRSLRCPGAFATGPQRIQYRWQRQRSRWGTSASQSWLASAGSDYTIPSRVFGNLGRPMRDLNDPMRRAYRSVASIYNTLDVLGAWEGANMEPQPWQRELMSQWYTGPVEVQFPRPRFIAPWGDDFRYAGMLADGESVSIGIEDPDIEAVRYSTSPNYRGGEVRGPGPLADYIVWDEATGLHDPSVMEGITVPKMYMPSGHGGRESMTRLRPGGPALMRYWGPPRTLGTWWELDLWNGRVWTGVDITTEVENVHDVRNRGRRGQTFPPTRSTFIELTALGGLHINPIGVIAVGATNRDGSHHILRAYVKSHTNDPPVLYNDDRHPARHQPTSWVKRDFTGTHPEHLVAMMREAENL